MADELNESWEIRPARPDDSEEISRLSAELGYPASVGAIGSNLAALLASARYFVSVAERGSRLLGWAVVERRLMLESGERAELTGLVVSASARRMGVGRALVAAAEHWGLGQGMKSIYVRSNVAREESHPFYLGLGYHRKKSQHTYEKLLVSA